MHDINESLAFLLYIRVQQALYTVKGKAFPELSHSTGNIISTAVEMELPIQWKQDFQYSGNGITNIVVMVIPI